MGLHERSSSHANFLAVKHGSLCLESNEPIEGYEEVTVNNPSTNQEQTKYIKRFAALDGRITRLEWYDRTNGGVRYVGLKIHIRDGSQHFQLDLPFGKRHFDYFTKIMDNIDFESVIEFNAWPDRKDKRQTAFVAKQNGDYIPWKYTRDDMGECPVPKQDAMGNWDFRDQRVWLYKRLIEVIIPKVEAINAFNEPEPEYTSEAIDEGQKAVAVGSSSDPQAPTFNAGGGFNPSEQNDDYSDIPF